MIWIIGQYSDRIQNADELLDNFLETFKEEATEVIYYIINIIQNK